MLLVTAAAAAPPELTRVAASGEAAPGAQGAVFVRHTAAGFDADGVLVWRATLEDDEGERDAFLRSTTAGTDALHDGEPAPDGGVFGLSGLSPTPDADGSVFVAQPADHVALYAHRDDGVEVLVAEGDPLDSGPVEQFVIAAAHGGDVLLRETAPGGQVSLLWARRGAQLTRAVVFDQPLDAIPGWNGDGLNRSGWLADGGIATFGVAEATTGRRAFATGPAGAPRLVDPQPWLPEGATCCVLLGVSGGGQAVYRGETVDGADTTVHLFAGPVDAPVEVLALPPGGIPIGNGQLGALAGPPVLGAREGFAFVGDQAVMFVYTPSAGLVRAVAPGEDGWAGVAPTPLAVSAAGHVAFEDTVDGHLGVYEWSPAGIEPWLVGGDVVEHPLEGDLTVATARFVGTSESWDAGRVALSAYDDDGEWVLLSTLADPQGGGGGGDDDDDDSGADGDGGEKGGCGCHHPSAPGAAGLVLLVLLRRGQRGPSTNAPA
jgi:hypothetical protein